MESTPPLLPVLKDLIQREGPISLSQFMEICLYHSTYGYYIQHSPIGSSQDFITAPEVSQLFGEMIGLFFTDLWEKMERPASFSLVEFGPGKGTLLADILRVFYKLSLSPTLYLLETNKTLQEIQEKALSPFKIPIQWFASLEELLSHLPPQPTFFLGNEFLDTFPVDQYIYENKQWRRKDVTWAKAGLEYTLAPPQNVIPLLDSGIQGPLDPAVKSRGDSIQDDFVEYSEKQHQFLETLCTFQINNPQSFSLFIDYGYAQGSGDTFQALKNHKYVDPLVFPGTCDLTAHVNFGALSSFIKQKKFQVYGPTEQGTFLQNLGIDIRAQNLARQNPSHEKPLQEALYRLTSPSQMGTLFKVWGFSPSSFSPSGF